MEDFKNRLLEFIERQYAMSQRKFEEACGLAQGTISSIKGQGPTVGSLLKIANTCPELNMNWLISGMGEMLNTTSAQTPTPSVSIGTIQTVNIGNWGELVELLKTNKQ